MKTLQQQNEYIFYFVEGCFYVMCIHLLGEKDNAKGQLISECPYEIIVSPIRSTRFLP